MASRCGVGSLRLNANHLVAMVSCCPSEYNLILKYFNVTHLWQSKRCCLFSPSLFLSFSSSICSAAITTVFLTQFKCPTNALLSTLHPHFAFRLPRFFTPFHPTCFFFFFMHKWLCDAHQSEMWKSWNAIDLELVKMDLVINQKDLAVSTGTEHKAFLFVVWILFEANLLVHFGVLFIL